MGDLINLRRKRKAKAKQAAEAKASANRVQHGRSKAETKLGKAEKDVATRKLDAHRIRSADADE
jgi:Domain of unknown function (DUF4169)